MQLEFSPKANEHLGFWIKSGNKAILKKITELIEAALDNPYQGIGKPEALKHDLSGCWSRRIDKEHRFV